MRPSRSCESYAWSGLALSGGGFRAAIYHLGVIRFLRDAQILLKISHITSVSGGSVTGAHLALNWDRYCGSATEFQQAAGEVIRFVQLDVRNRIVRRFPLGSAANTLIRLARVSPRRHLTRTGMLEQHYQKFLFGDTSLFQLPDRPRLHILATNLSEGCLCSFFQGGLLLQRRVAGRRDVFEKVNFGLATVPMAVAASSAFPGFFPPLQFSGSDVGTHEGEFSRQAFTDGGVIDNLGLRMFRCIEQSWIRDITPLSPDDIANPDAMVAAMNSPQAQATDTSLGRLRELLGYRRNSSREQDQVSLEKLVQGIGELIRLIQFYHDPMFAELALADTSARSLFDFVRASKHELELGDHLWLNRQIVDATLQTVVDGTCLRANRDSFSSILVSDAGATFKVAPEGRAGGIILTALRSSDIAVDRVYQLELEAFRESRGTRFFPMTDVVTRAQDPHAPHPEIQRQASRIRTDMDRFSDLEIAALTQHGYCVARNQCRSLADQLNVDLPDGPPWNPFGDNDDSGRSTSVSLATLSDEGQALSVARELQKSSKRKTWSTLFSLRDWPTYFWVPLIVCLALSLPYTVYKLNKKSQQQDMVLSAIAETSPVYREILRALAGEPPPPMPPSSFVEVDEMKPVDFTGFEIITDTRIFDLRRWSSPSESKVTPSAHVRIRVRRTPGGEDNPHLRIQATTTDDTIQMDCETERVNPVLSRMRLPDGKYQWELDLDLSHVAIGDDTEVVFEETVSPQMAEQRSDGGWFRFTLPVDTGLVQIWVLMPPGRSYDVFEISGYPIGHREKETIITPNSQVELPFGAIATFQLINPQHNYRYERRWRWSDAVE
jgi:predicted acylesterase/phospholipase RssA